MVYNTIYPAFQNPYVARDTRKFVKKKEDEESSQSSRSNQTDNQEEKQINQYSRGNVYQKLKDSKQAHEKAVASRDANIKNSSINIAQIMKDFRSTAAAIATPPELSEEVETYLKLVEAQVTKEDPNTKIVKSNLKTAASLLDNYITETLQRPSQVVENWLDALFLQHINYTYNAEEVNAQFLVKFPGEKKAQETQDAEETEDSEEVTQEETSSILPLDSELKSLFVQAKKFAYASDYKKAMQFFNTALARSVDIEDGETQSKILFEIGKIYDKFDYLSQALQNYNKSLSITRDVNVKTQAHYSMAQIYDDIAEFEPAINHYMTSISYAGEAENLPLQSASLTKIGNIYSDQYDKEAFEYLGEAKLISNQTQDSKVKGYVSSSMGRAYSKFNQPQNALKSYSDAVREYSSAQSPDKVAINYKRAAELMEAYNNKVKAKALLEKAYKSAQLSEDAKLISDIRAKLNQI